MLTSMLTSITIYLNAMPLDRMRIPGPEDSKPPFVYETPSGVDVSNLVKTNGCRKDGRKADHIRPMFIKCGIISQAQGSVYIEFNNTKVICGVYGPREFGKREDFSMNGRLTCDFKFATFSCKQRRQHQQDAEEKELSQLLLQSLSPAVCLHKFPKAQVDIYVIILENDGSALSAAVTCGSLALADAGIEMYDMVVACSARKYFNSILLDPTAAEEIVPMKTNESVDEGEMTVAYMPSLNQVSGLILKGEMHTQVCAQIMKSCLEGCNLIYPVLQQSLITSIRKSLSNVDLQGSKEL
ncbi:PREDICTED: exosome complex component MTR3-like [Priapulus caudatus]|uniref:Exosome complex component MTR3-like n=1 Tax=Priapulus caudatus TaxID=37621 RepID=A0ABM1F9K3_PRICU|nr:PREDICTED: exosome complex component MTR3-like [Priapulus caudatus]